MTPPPQLPDGFLRELRGNGAGEAASERKAPSCASALPSQRKQQQRRTISEHVLGSAKEPPRAVLKKMKLASCEKKIQFLLDGSCIRGCLQGWDCHTQFVSLRQSVCAINWFTASLGSASQESAFGPELYFYVLGEVLTYLDKGLNFAGCPAAGMDKHEGGMFDIQGPVSEGTAVARTQSGRSRDSDVQLM